MVLTIVGLALSVTLAGVGWYMAGRANVSASLASNAGLAQISFTNLSDQTVLIDRVRVDWAMRDGSTVKRRLVSILALAPRSTVYIDEPNVSASEFVALISTGQLRFRYRAKPPFAHYQASPLRSYPLLSE